MLDLIDIGVNLTHRSFAGDLDAVLARAGAAGVGVLVATGTSVPHSRDALALAQRHPGRIYATAGVHPHEASRCDAAARRDLERLVRAEAVVAVGECGLDFNRNFSPRPVQERVFADQVALACAVHKPLFLHERDAHPAFVAILDRAAGPGDRLPVPAVVHCFTGDEEALTAYLQRGLYIGITGWICDERRGQRLQQLVRRIPLDRLMIETDAPFLLPRDLAKEPGADPSLRLASGRNEPATLPHIARRVARCVGRPVEEVATATTANAARFFGLKKN